MKTISVRAGLLIEKANKANNDENNNIHFVKGDRA
jgi:hypothetical protein